MSEFASVRAEVCDAYRRLGELGLVAGSSGNVSALVPGRSDLIAITPSRVPFDRMTPEDVLVVDFEVEPVEGDGVPSSESLAHVAVYQNRADVSAVAHFHPVYATALAVMGMELPPIVDELVVYIGGPVGIAEYALASTAELAQRAVQALGDRNAVLLRHHGALSCGRDLGEALAVAELVERVARIYTVALGLGRVPQLPEEAVAVEAQIFRMAHRKGAPQ